MPRPLAPAEYDLLRAWAALSGPSERSLALRASWLLASSSLDTPSISKAATEGRAMALQAAFDRIGLLAVVDEPRAGRPPKPAPGEGPDRGSLDAEYADADRSRDALWRNGRKTGRSITRNRHGTAIHRSPSCAAASLCALYVGDRIWLAASRQSVQVQAGIWYHPQQQARRNATQAMTVAGLGRPITTLHSALTSHLKSPGPARPRAEQEKIVFWCWAVGQLAQRFPIRISMAAEPDAPMLLQMLKQLRRYLLWPGDGGRLDAFTLVDAGTWHDGLRAHLGTEVLPRLQVEGGAFAWCG